MLSKTLLVLFASAASIAASTCDADKNDDKNRSSTPTLPRSGGAKELTDPPEGLKLLHIALGLGIQNYTCEAAGAAPVAVGALAVLWDARPLLPGQGPAALDDAAFAALPGAVLGSTPLPLRMDGGGGNASSAAGPRADPAHPGASLTDPFPAAPAALAVEGAPEPLAPLGRHFFDAAGAPTFVIDADPALCLAVRKDEAVDAPAGAPAGPDGTGAVAWLKLSAAAGPPALVYRVLTAGGASHGCAGPGGDSTAYAATYWFYG